MNRLALTTAALALLTTPALAGGYVAPVVVEAPTPAPAYNWTGPYAGLSYGSQKTTSQRAIYEDRVDSRPATKADVWQRVTDAGGCEHPRDLYWFTHEGHASYVTTCKALMEQTPSDSWSAWEAPWADPVTTEWQEQVGTETHRRTDSTMGAFAGFRKQWENRMVAGFEAQYSRVGDADSIRTLGQVGYALGRALPYATAGYDWEQEAAVYGVGLDVAVTERVIGGLLYTQDDSGDAKRIEARVGFRF